MERKMILGILVFAVLATGALMLVPIKEDRRPEMLPWTVTVNPDGTSTVFGLTLGHTTLSQAEKQLDAEAEISVFLSPSGKLSGEAYFDNVTLSGLGAKLVLEAGLSEEELQGMFDRGVRITTTENGSRKVTLHPDDAAKLGNTPIASLTYLPKANLDDALVLKRFGEPQQRVAEDAGKVVHWLYPQRGLDVAVSPTEKEVLQYVPPRDFTRLMAPVLARAAEPAKAAP